MRTSDFERLYAEHAASLFSFLAYRTGDRVEAEDVLSETFERALLARSRFDRRRASEKTWLYSIALNLLRDRIRRRGAEARAVERTGVAASDASAPSGLEGVEDRDWLQRALTTLSDEEREAVALRFGAGLSVPEMAKATGERLTTVEGRVYRALRKLREELE